eukprot:2991523-Rhodomonas_salina.2
MRSIYSQSAPSLARPLLRAAQRECESPRLAHSFSRPSPAPAAAPPLLPPRPLHPPAPFHPGCLGFASAPVDPHALGQLRAFRATQACVPYGARKLQTRRHSQHQIQREADHERIQQHVSVNVESEIERGRGKGEGGRGGSARREGEEGGGALGGEVSAIDAVHCCEHGVLLDPNLPLLLPASSQIKKKRSDHVGF